MRPSSGNSPNRTPFLKGIQHPKSAVTLKVGGRVPEGSEGAIKDAVARIFKGMEEGITAALQTSSSDGNGVTMLAQPFSPRDLWIPADQVPTHFRQVAGRLGAILQAKKAGSRSNGCASRMPAIPGVPTRSRGR